MAKETTTLDEELYDGIQKARKKKALNFCLIGKGPEVLKLIVQKKKISDGMAAKAKTEAKGSLIITGVVIGEGVELTFEVTGEEPSIKPIKLKEFIADQTDLTVKAKWAVVKTLQEVKDDDDAVPPAPPQPGAPQATTATPTPPVAPPTPPEATDELAQLKVKLKDLTPKVQAAIVANPASKDKLLGAVGTCKQQIKDGKVAGAKESLIEVLKLLNEKPSATTPPQAPPQTPPQQTQPPQAPSQAPPTPPPTSQPPPTADAAYAKQKARFAAVRGTWIKVKDQAVANIHAIRDGMVAEYKDVPQVKQQLANGVKELNDVAAKFNDELKLKFDAFIADPPPPAQERAKIKAEVLALVEGYRSEIEGNSIYEDLDQREFAQVLVKAPLLKA